MRLLIATNNAGKAREYRELLAGLAFELVTPADIGLDLDVEEGADSFEANAVAKAQAFAVASGLLSLADDSGLEVEALGGEPGVRARRYAGEDATDPERVAFLLSKLADVPWERRRASFRCVIAIAAPHGEVEVCDGSCDGYIALEPAGGGGFGYDPIFYAPELSKTMAELTSEQKNAISHRARAAAVARRLLERRLRS